MNIIVMGNFHYPQGMAGTKRVQHFIDYLHRHGNNLKILLLRQGGADRSLILASGRHRGVPFWTIGQDIAFNSKILWQYPVYLSKGIAYLLRWKRKNSKNILFVYGGPNLENIWFLLIAKIIGYKILFDIVEDHTHFDGALNFTSKVKLTTSLLFTRLLPFLADGLIVISNHLLQKHSEVLNDETPIEYIPISANAQTPKPKQRFGNPVKIVYSGSFAQKDGVEYLIEAFESVRKQYPNIRLLLTGKGAPNNIDRITQMIQNSESIQYLGYLDDTSFYEFLKKADILCMVRTKSEFANAGFPFKLGEYLATGNPVIASNVSDIGDYLENKNDAMLVSPDSAEETANAIEFLITNPERAIEIGRSGKEKCKRYFNPERNGRRLFKLMETV